MGPRALTASSGLAPWSMAVDLGSVEKNPTALGGRGGHPRNFHTSSKNARGFLHSQKIKKTFCPAVPRRGLEAGSIIFRYDFIVLISVTTRVAKIKEIKNKKLNPLFPRFSTPFEIRNKNMPR